MNFLISILPLAVLGWFCGHLLARIQSAERDLRRARHEVEEIAMKVWDLKSRLDNPEAYQAKQEIMKHLANAQLNGMANLPGIGNVCSYGCMAPGSIINE